MDKDIEMRDSTDQAAYHDLSSLKARGWTARLVQKFLGEPDDTDRARVANTGRPKNLYCAKRVASIEIHDPQFKAEKDKAAMYSARLKQTQSVKKKNLAGLVGDITLPEFDLPYNEVLDQVNKKRYLTKNWLEHLQNGLRSEFCWIAWPHLHGGWKFLVAMPGYAKLAICSKPGCYLI